METTADFLDALRVKLNLPSDGRLAVYFGMQRQHLSKYRTLGHTFDDAMSLRVADILELDPAYVLACMHHQRAKQAEVKQVWERLAKRLAVAAAVMGVAVLGPDILSASGLDASSPALLLAAFTDRAMYIMSNLAVQYWPVFLPLFAFSIAARSRHTARP